MICKYAANSFFAAFIKIVKSPQENSNKAQESSSAKHRNEASGMKKHLFLSGQKLSFNSILLTTCLTVGCQ